MTTVISNEKYLLADHRITGPHFDKYDSWGKGHAKSRGPRAQRPEQRLDNCLKISVLERPISVVTTDTSDDVRIKNIVAVSGSGCVDTLQNIKTIARSFAGETMSVRAIKNTLCPMRQGSTVVFYSDTGHGYCLTKSDKTTRVNAVPIYETSAIGSGSTIVTELLPHLSKDVGIHELMALASYFDPHTSPSYSAYEFSSGIYYPIITPSLESIEEIVKNVLANKLRISKDTMFSNTVF